MAIYSEFSHKKNVIFHSYVSLPEGIWFHVSNLSTWKWNMWDHQVKEMQNMFAVMSEFDNFLTC